MAPPSAAAAQHRFFTEWAHVQGWWARAVTGRAVPGRAVSGRAVAGPGKDIEGAERRKGGGGRGEGGRKGGRMDVGSDRTRLRRWAISDPTPSGLGRLTSQSPSTRAGQSWEPCYTTIITRTGVYGRGLIPTHPAPGRGLRLLSTPPVPEPPGPPGPLRPAGPDGGTLETRVPGCRRSRSTISPRLLRPLCVVCGGRYYWFRSIRVARCVDH